MSTIRILDEDVSNRIAAGEVVERPASIVKELVENSLDAGASRISIAVDRGGRSLVRVVDDGHGMDSEDALLCLEAHATSKIRETDDIECIATLGFRGEALPSIASVSRFLLRTRTSDSDEGTEVLVSGGVIQDVTSVGCAPGTSITARNLFFNMPARRKFLRTVPTEEGHIQEMTLVLALANPDVGFELSFDQRSIIRVQPGQDLRTRAMMLLGRDTLDAMLDVEHSEAGVRVYGFTARPGYTRSSRRDQRVFVNGRPISNPAVNHAVRTAYHTLVMKGRYPPVLLFLELDPSQVDINVHPAKREVRFRDGRGVGKAVGNAIRDALRQTATRPDQAGNREDTTAGRNEDGAGAAHSPGAADRAERPAWAPEPMSLDTPLTGTPKDTSTAADTDADDTLKTPETIDSQSEADEPAKDILPLVDPDSRRAAGTAVSAADRSSMLNLDIVGTLGNSYLLAETGDGLVVIDQHAAHERIMFERFLKHAEARDGAAQRLLIPVTMDASAADAQLLRKYRDEFVRLGFEIEDFGGNSFIVQAIPPHFPQENIIGIIRDLLDDLQDNPIRSHRPDEHQVATAACKAAVKAHDRLQPQEIENLLKQLVQTEMPYTCPHGRPTMIKISYTEFEKRFGRRAP